MKYFTGEIYGGVSLRSTVASGNDVERERIYDMIFRLHWRCEVVKQTLALFFISECDVLGLATCVIHIFKNFNAASTDSAPLFVKKTLSRDLGVILKRLDKNSKRSLLYTDI